MRFVAYTLLDENTPRLAVRHNGGLLYLPGADPKPLIELIRNGRQALLEAGAAVLRDGARLDESSIRLLPPVPHPGKIICIGLNYMDHSQEVDIATAAYPTYFLRVPGSVVGHQEPLILPRISSQFDYEGEMVAVIGKTGRHIAKEDALDHIAGYSVGNEGSIRDFQFKGNQWTPGKNFDCTAAIGPEFVTADELPPGGAGLAIQTVLNGAVVQSANTSDMIFDVKTIISILSEVMTLEPGDVIFTGTPAGVGMARDPQLFMKHGDSIHVEIEKIGRLSNTVWSEGRSK